MNKQILLIDDDLVQNAFLKSYLQKQFEVVTATHGQQALAWLEENPLPDLIICDLQMPQIDGFAFLEKVKADPNFQHLPVIMLSGAESSEERIKCLEMGAEDFICKPYNPRELEIKILKIFAGKRDYEPKDKAEKKKLI